MNDKYIQIIENTNNNLFLNLSFEEVDENYNLRVWNIWNNKGVFKAIIDKSNSKLGQYSVKMFNGTTDNARGTINQSINEIPSYLQRESLKVSQWIKTEEFNGTALRLRLQFKNIYGSKLQKYPVIDIPVNKNQDWIKYEFIIDLPDEDLSNIQFEYLYDNAKGSVWIDDIIVNPFPKQIDKENKYYNLNLDIDSMDIRVRVDHPKLLASDETFDKLRNDIGVYVNLNKWFEELKINTDKILSKSIILYNKPDGIRLNTLAADYIRDLSFMYRITNDKKYAIRCWNEIENICLNYGDWGKEHLLDAAKIAYGVALGYDWLYDYLNSDKKELVENSVKEKILDDLLSIYKEKKHFFVDNEFNWNSVCNAGFLALALAFTESKNKEVCLEIIKESLKSVQNGLTQYYPNGEYMEGVGYWAYGTGNLVLYFDMVEKVIKNKIDLTKFKGIRETGEFPIYMTGKQGMFNFSDNNTGLVAAYINLWFAKKFKRADLTWYHKYYVEHGGAVTIYDLLWYDKDYYIDEIPSDLDRYYEKQSVVTMRNNWEDDKGVFIGLKGGENGLPHGDLDVGSFVFDALGVRWIKDLGSENYNLPGYWDLTSTGLRWSYYRKKAEGHNTYVINPNVNADQSIGIKAEIVKKMLNTNKDSFAIIDMRAAYNEAIRFYRGFKFINRRELLIRDEFKLSEQSEFIFQMHTSANINISSDGKSAILSENNKRIYIKLITNENIKLEAREARSIFGKSNSQEYENSGINKLIIQGTVLEEIINIWIVPLNDNENIPVDEPEVKQLDKW